MKFFYDVTNFLFTISTIKKNLVWFYVLNVKIYIVRLTQQQPTQSFTLSSFYVLLTYEFYLRCIPIRCWHDLTKLFQPIQNDVCLWRHWCDLSTFSIHPYCKQQKCQWRKWMHFFNKFRGLVYQFNFNTYLLKKFIDRYQTSVSLTISLSSSSYWNSFSSVEVSTSCKFENPVDKIPPGAETLLNFLKVQSDDTDRNL